MKLIDKAKQAAVEGAVTKALEYLTRIRRQTFRS